MQFYGATGLPLHELRTVGEHDIDGLQLSDGEWALVQRPDGGPHGWIDAAGVQRHRGGDRLDDSVIAGGSLLRPGGTLRTALDAALSSPSGYGVAVDDDGRVRGGVRAADVLSALNPRPS